MNGQDKGSALPAALVQKRNGMARVLARYATSVENALPQGIDARRFCRIAVNAVLRNPALGECDPASFVVAVINAAETGLEPSIGQGALVPYKGKVQFQPMYQGLIELAMRSDRVSWIDANVVQEGDEFDFALGTDPYIKHKPRPEKHDDAGTWSHVYAVARMKDGSTKFEVMSFDDVMSIKARSAAVRAGKSTPWDTDEEEMAKKTVTKRLCKYLPKDPRLSRALELDQRAEAGRAQVPADNDLPEDLATIAARDVTEEDRDAAGEKTGGRDAPPRRKTEREKAIEEAKSLGIALSGKENTRTILDRIKRAKKNASAAQDNRIAKEATKRVAQKTAPLSSVSREDLILEAIDHEGGPMGTVTPAIRKARVEIGDGEDPASWDELKDMDEEKLREYVGLLRAANA